jgi:hypothetical protein
MATQQRRMRMLAARLMALAVRSAAQAAVPLPPVEMLLVF